MKIVLLKNYIPYKKKVKKGTVMEVTNEKGKELIKKKIAKEYNGVTTDDELAERYKQAKEEIES